MSDLNKIAQSAKILSGYVPFGSQATNGASAQSGMQRRFFANETRANAFMVGELATNCYDTQSQGIDEEDFFKYIPIRIRVDKAAQVTTGETMLDDWQKIHIIAPANIDTIRQGALMEFDNNTWIVYKPQTVTSVIGSAIIRRCNTVINKLDYYGNIVAIPMSFSKVSTQGNAPTVTENNILSKNYINCICQLNDLTEEFTENTRLILGKAAYAIRGINDFTREFTNDAESIHLLTFSVERQEPLEQDSLELQCADYHSFKWEIMTVVNKSMAQGTTQTIGVTSLRNGEKVQPTLKYPISYQYKSSDESILTIDSNGLITAVAEGNATITVSLTQNPAITQSVTITVANTGTDYVDFTNTQFNSISEFDSMDISACYYANGVATTDEVTFTFSGAPTSCYTAQKIADNTYRITCYQTSNTPLDISISANGKNKNISIQLTN